MANTADSLTENWNAKLQSYTSLINDLKERVYAAKEMPIGPKNALGNLVLGLGEFASEQFRDFLEGFSNNTIVETDEEPKEYVLQKILDQIGNDLMVLQQIAGDWYHNSIKQEPLKLGTVFAENALQLAYNNHFLPSTVIPFIYLHKTPVIRVIPYANAALIGIPYTAVDTTNLQNGSNLRDLLAIPHEVGHYVYWNGEHKGIRIKDYLEARLKEQGLSQYAHWLEETFADVYSALVGGTVTAHSIQEILLDNRPIFFDLDDGWHPPDVIRPFIYAYALDDNDGKTISDWKKFIEERGLKSFKRAVIELENKRISSLKFLEISFGNNADPDGLQEIKRLVELVKSIFKDSSTNKWGHTIGSGAYDEVKSNPKLRIDKFKNDVLDWEIEIKSKRFVDRLDVISGWTSGGEEDGYHTIE